MANVSITLNSVGDGRAIADAIVQDNKGALIHELPACLKIDCPDRLVINKKTVSDRIGRDWDVQEIHLSLISLAGNVDEDDDYFALEWKR